MSETNLQQAIIKDSLSKETRNERRNLLAVSALGIFMVKTGFLPTKISALGIEFTQTDKNTILWGIGAVVIYFLVGFIVYSVSDFWSYNLNIYSSHAKLLLSKAEALINQSKDFSELETEIKKVKDEVIGFSEGVSQIKKTVGEQVEKSRKKLEDSKIGVENKIQKKEVINQLENLRQHLTDKQTEFDNKKKLNDNELDLLQRKIDLLKVKTTISRFENLTNLTRIIAYLRLIFEYLIPVLVSVYAIIVLFTQQ